MTASSNEQPYVTMLAGGHPNSLGRTLEVVEHVLADEARVGELYACYRSPDEVVRLRTSNALKRVAAVHPEWFVPYLDRLIGEIGALDQASAQWTLAQLFGTLRAWMSPAQYGRARSVLQRNLDHNNDWIVRNTTMETLAAWSVNDAEIIPWLRERLERYSTDPRKSVAGRAKRLAAQLAKRTAR